MDNRHPTRLQQLNMAPVAFSNGNSVAINATRKDTKSPSLIKLCRVCGDKAIAFNFNGLTCESCKSFFRRNAMKINKFVCVKNENCKIELNTRSLCKKCRLKKCIEIGMKKEMVLEKRRQTAKSREDKQETSLIDLILKQIDEIDNGLLLSRYDDVENQQENQIVMINSINDLGQEIDLNKYETSLIEEVAVANTIFVEELALPVKGEIGTFAAGLNWVGVYIRKIIKFCKNIPPFKCIDKEDQLLVIKPFFTEGLLVRFTFAYSYEADAFPIIQDESSQNTVYLKIGRLAEAGLVDFAHKYRKFIINCKQEMENDVTIRNLLETLLLFRPRENITCPEFLRYHYFVYMRVLGRYLEHKYRDVEQASQKFDKLLYVVDQVSSFRQPISDLYTLVEQQELDDVLTEIYDLKLQFDKLSI